MKKVFLFLLVSIIHQAGMASIDSELDAFFKNPDKYYFEQRNTLSGNGRVSILKSQRQAWINSLVRGKSAPRRNDLVDNLLPGFRLVKNLKEMEDQDLFKASLEQIPWSDDYWPIYKGVIAARYADNEFYYLEGWKGARSYVLENPAMGIVASGDAEKIALLSPAEKFDLLIGDSNFSLTKSMWKQGEYYYNNSEDGSIETWMGICHGWAPASYMVPRPRQAIEVMAADNRTKVKFFPSDLKALASLLWSSAKFNTHFIGGRCNQAGPSMDDRHLSDCLDNNAASFHLSLINAIGVIKKSFVMDVTYDYEVWNQPVISYEYKYFNPLTQERTYKLDKAKVRLAEYQEDRFKKYRASNTSYIVGIALEVSYGVETSPTHNEYDSEDMDEYNTAYYIYDLELDKNGKIVGGEWHNTYHPDFLWTPDYSTKALASEDYYLMSKPAWNGTKALPSNIKRLGNRAAQRGIPLAYIVNSLINLSNSLGERYE